MFHGRLDCIHKPPHGGKPITKPGDHGTPTAHNRWFILFYHVWGPAWIEIHWNSIWSRARSHMTSHYTWGSVTTLHDFGGVLGRPLDTFFWALTISWSRLLAHVWIGHNHLKSQCFHVMISNTCWDLSVFFIKSRYIPQIPLKRWLIFLEVLNFNHFSFSNSIGSILPLHWSGLDSCM